MILFIIYMIIGFFVVKPKSFKDFNWTYVDYSEGFFMFAVPLWLWFLFWIFWLFFSPFILFYLYEKYLN